MLFGLGQNGSDSLLWPYKISLLELVSEKIHFPLAVEKMKYSLLVCK